MELLYIFLSVIILIVTIFLYYTMTYFKRAGIPHESPWPLVGNMAPVLMRKSHFIENSLKYYNRWPDAKYVGIYDCVTPVIMIRDVELIKQIGVKSFENFINHRTFVDETLDPLFGKSLFGLKDSKWKEVRSLLTPSFTASKMRLMFDLMAVCSKQFTEYLIKDANKGINNIDIKDAFTKYTNDVIASCAFGLNVDTMKDQKNEFYQYGKKAATFNPFQISKLFFVRFCPTLSRWLNVRVFDPKVTDFFVKLVKENIEMRQKNGISRPDMMQLMIEQRDCSANKMNIIEMTAQAFIFFFAGFDTTSSLMSFTAVALGLHPNVQKQLLDEIDNVMEKTNGNPSYEDINAMPYLEAVLYETLRYYPVVGILDRVCNGTFELPPALPGLKPFIMKPGMSLWFPSYGIHTDPTHYERPEIYDPDRFLGKKMSTNISTFLAFGIGPRACIGNRFALLESKLVLFHLMSKCKFETSDKLKQPIEFQKSSLLFTVFIEGGFWVKLIPRH